MQDIEQLYNSGDIAELRKINEKLAKTANQRRAQFYKSGIRNSSALNRMEYYNQQLATNPTSGVFSRSKKIVPEDLKEQIKEELIFLRSPTSTVTGEKQRRAEKSFDVLTKGKIKEDGTRDKPYLEIPEDIKVPSTWLGSAQEYFRSKFLSFLDQDVWKDIKKFLYSENTNVLAEAGEAIARGAKISDLRQAYNDYLRGEVEDIYTLWENWTSI